MEPMKKFSWIIVLLLSACIGTVEMELDSSEPVLVVDGLVSDVSGQSMVTLGWTFPVGTPCFSNGSFIGLCEIDHSVGPHKVTGVLRVRDLDINANLFSSDFRMKDKVGMIEIPTFISGTPGHRYQLTIDITYEGRVENYTAEAIMLATPPIEETTYEIRKGDVGKSDNLVPLISFHEPQGTDDYYLFRLCQVSKSSGFVTCGNSRVWSYSVLSDQFLPADVKGLSIDDGASIARYAEFYPRPEPDNGVEVRMYRVPKSVYDFYVAMLAQFSNDGGAYTPAPASPPGNISNNGVGLFRAWSESRGRVFTIL
jgi:Domain of unknown function (DUF4249)